MIMNKKIIFSIALLFIVFVFAYAWWRGLGGRTPNYDGPTEKVVLQLKWLHQAQFAGFYAAAQEGFYREEGLDVTILPVGGDLSEANVINSVDKGEVQFGVVGGDKVILARAADEGVKAISVIYQQSPVVFAALSNSGITKLGDLIGKKMGVEKGQNTEIVYRAMMRKAGVDTSKVKEVAAPLGIDPLAKGTIDARMFYMINETLDAAKNGYELNIIYPEDYGLQIYADTLITSDALIAQNRNLVQRFVRATIKGWNWALLYPEDAGVLSLRYNSHLNAAHEINMMKASLPLIYTGKSAVGGMSHETWDKMENILLDGKLLKTRIPLEDIFTTQFL
jgi:ABC-type nitrate/sulfonate/bicarbonate transport system substrate-binding protein